MRLSIQLRRSRLALGPLTGLLRDGAFGTPASIACWARLSSLMFLP
jgi:hypothetical protein